MRLCIPGEGIGTRNAPSLPPNRLFPLWAQDLVLICAANPPFYGMGGINGVEESISYLLSTAPFVRFRPAPPVLFVALLRTAAPTLPLPDLYALLASRSARKRAEP